MYNFVGPFYRLISVTNGGKNTKDAKPAQPENSVPRTAANYKER